MLPPYLAYAGWSLALAPGTWLGDLVARGPAWLPVTSTRAMSVVGLALWSWPIAAWILASKLRVLDQATLDAARLTGAGPWRRNLMVLGMVQGAVAAAVGSVALVMMNSAVPLHLAQVPTLAIDVWTDLSLGASAGQAWLRAWPIVAAGAIGAVVLTRRLAGAPDLPARSDEPTPPRRWAWAGWAAAIGMSVLAPLTLYGLNLRETASLGRFWVLSGSAVRESLVVASMTGVLVAGVALVVWCGLTCRPERSGGVRIVMAACTVLLLLGALSPGVLVGAAVRAWWNQAWLGEVGDWMNRSPLLLVLGHGARFACVGAAAGWLLAGREPSHLRDLRRLHGAQRVSDWWKLSVMAQPGVVVGVGLIGAALSAHEIEATVILAPVGSRPLAQQVLEHLHYNYVEEMGAAAVNLLVVTAAAAWLAGVLVWPRRPLNRPRASDESVHSA
ncbi:MAG: hypothetical protein JNJ48_06820 [Phycisphaerae bacterium]|nr:hypothetical protein [Phycisphaerae bacterium]